MFLLTGLDGRNFGRHSKKDLSLDNPLYLSVIISLWLGYKKVSKSNFLIKWFYYDSLDKNFLLEIAKNFVLKTDRVEYGIDYVFGPHANVIIPALIEMRIFEDVVAQLLEEEKSSNLKRRKKVSEMISAPKIEGMIISLQTNVIPGVTTEGITLYKKGTERFIELRKNFNLGVTQY